MDRVYWRLLEITRDCILLAYIWLVENLQGKKFRQKWNCLLFQPSKTNVSRQLAPQRLTSENLMSERGYTSGVNKRSTCIVVCTRDIL